MRAMILAAGRGERLRPLTDRVPKPLVPVAGRPLIEHHLQALAAAGFEDVVINVAHLADAITEALGDGGRFGLALHYSHEPPGALDTGGGIKQALPMLGDAPFAVINGDVFTDYDFGALRTGLAPGSDAHLLLVPNPPHHPAGDFDLRRSRIATDAPRYTFAGIGVYHPALFAGVDAVRFSLAAVLRPAIDAGRVGGAIHGGTWYDVGRPETLARVEELYG